MKAMYERMGDIIVAAANARVTFDNTNDEDCLFAAFDEIKRMCEVGKKMQPVSEDELHEAATEEPTARPAVAPYRGIGSVPSGADGTEPAEEVLS